MATQYDNLFLDLAASASHCGALERMVEIAGVEKVVYGSDFPLLDLSYQMGRVLHARLTREQKRAVFCGNARRLFRLGD
jgi:predicted TIM-barrel fold metal-dependent hydrolase